MPSAVTSGLLLLSVLLPMSVAGELDGGIDCPGILHVQGTSTGCCVGATVEPLDLSTCSGWPICDGPATTTTTATPLSCATDIPVTADDYGQLVSQAASSLSASGTHFRTTLNGQGAAVAPKTGTTATSGAAKTQSTVQSTDGPASSGSAAPQSTDGQGSSGSAAPQSTNAAQAHAGGALGALGGGIAVLALML